MDLPIELKNDIIKFLESLPNIHDKDTRRAFIYKASLDEELEAQIVYEKETTIFFQLLLRTFIM